MYGSMPHSVEVESEILGGVLCDPNTVKTVRKCGVLASDFYIARNGNLWTAIVALADKGSPIDPVTIQSEMKAQGTWEELESAKSMGRVLDKAGLSSNVEHYCEGLLRESLKRAVITASVDGAEEAREGDALDAIGGINTRLRELAQRSSGDVGLVASTGVKEYLHHIKEVQDGTVVDSRIPTGLAVLDERLGGGLKPGWQVVVMTNSGHGKTSLAVNNLALSCAKAGKPVLVCSLEMKPSDILARMIASESGIPVCAHEKPGLHSYDIAKMVEAGNTVGSLPLEIIDSGQGTVSAIRGAAEAMKLKYGALGMVVVDYIQLMKSVGGRRETTTEEDISGNSKALKHLAVELDCVTVVLSQPILSAKRERKRPTIQQAKGSGSIEDDCDVALVPWQPGLIDDAIPRGKAEMGMDKFRDGNRHSLSDEDIRWSGKRMRFEAV